MDQYFSLFSRVVRGMAGGILGGNFWATVVRYLLGDHGWGSHRRRAEGGFEQVFLFKVVSFL